MIIKTKRVNKTSDGGIQRTETIKEENKKPGFRRKAIEVYESKVKPGVKKVSQEVVKSVKETGEGIKNLFK